MTHLAAQRNYQVINRSRTHSAGFILDLDDGELLSGAVTITEIGTSNLVITSKAINASTITILNKTHIAGKALQCSVVSAVAGTYNILWKCSTDSSPSNDITLKTTIVIEVE